MDKSDAGHFKQLLQRENKMVATGCHSFLLYCPTDGQHIVLLVFQLPNHRKNTTLVMHLYGLHLCQLAQEVRRANQGTVFVSWPGVRTILGNNAVASDECNTTDHSITQKHARDVGEGKVCQAWKVGAQHAAVPRQLCENQTFLLKVNPYSVYYCNIVSLIHSSWVPDSGGGRQKEELQTAVLLSVCTSVYPTTSLPRSSVWIPQL